jgi:multidrug efflux system membrane fusion protein
MHPTPNRLPATLVLALLSSLVLAACGKGEATKTTPTTPALVQAAVPADGGNGNRLSGEVRAHHEADLGFRIPGKIVARLVDAGTAVKAGTVLARLDPADVQQATEAASAQVAAAKAEFSNAKAELERYRSLFERKFVSQAVLDQRQTAFDAAKARFDQATAEQARARNQLGYATLVADRAGIITQVNADIGQVVAAGQSVMRLAGPDEPEVLVNVPESRINEVQAQRSAPVTVTLWNTPGARYAGRIREIAGAADPASRTFAMRVSILKPDAEVHLGTTADVALSDTVTAPRGASNNAGAASPVRIPLTAITRKDDSATVWVLDAQAGTVAPRAVTVARYGDADAIVSAGLAPGEQVVVAGVHKLLPGQKVKPMDATRGARES